MFIYTIGDIIEVSFLALLGIGFLVIHMSQSKKGDK